MQVCRKLVRGPFNGSNTPTHFKILKDGFQSSMTHCYVWTVHALATINICLQMLRASYILQSKIEIKLIYLTENIQKW